MSLTKDQVHTLNEKYGWFEFRDAQGDVSVAFANDAIAMHERLRADAPALLDALELAYKALDAIADEMTVGERFTNAGQYLLDALPPALALIEKHRGEK